MSFPVAFPLKNLLDSILTLYDGQGDDEGAKTGWPSLDIHYRPAPGQLTLVSGYPGSGKSSFLDALFLNLARSGWRFGIFSPENVPVAGHGASYLERFTGKPFREGPTPRMTKEEAVEAVTEMGDWFAFLRPNPFGDADTFAVDAVLEAFQNWLAISGFLRSENRCGAIIDPWNELEHWRPANMTETEYVSATLSKIRHWARNNRVHVWLVAHPQKLRRDDTGKLPVPRPNDALGSVHFWNKADNFLTIHRDQATQTDEVEIHVQKIRFKHLGRPGLVTLRWDRVSGRYWEPPKKVRAVGGRDE